MAIIGTHIIPATHTLALLQQQAGSISLRQGVGHWDASIDLSRAMIVVDLTAQQSDCVGACLAAAIGGDGEKES
eukprot:COSAG04_NODE_2231_length_4481_cov_7.647649_6_plen_74_part_00